MRRRRRRRFTLTELMAVVAIIGLLAGFVGVYPVDRRSEREARCFVAWKP